MSIAQQPSLYQEQVKQVTSHEEVDRALADLTAAKTRWRDVSLDERIALVQSCLDGMMRVTRPWVEAAWKAKGLGPGDPLRSEDVLNGPLATARYLRLLMQSLEDIKTTGMPRLPRQIYEGPNGQLRAPVMPARGLFDGLLFQGFRAEVWLEPGVTLDDVSAQMASYYRVPPSERPVGVALVLGAGNVSSIAPTDAFTKLFHEGKVVLLKMNPVNEYVGPFFDQAFKSLIDAGYLRIVYGGADVGSYAVGHDAVDEVHITGSIFSHHTIVWGPPGEERQRRMAEHDPLLKKTITSELGNVSPWIVVPGPYSDKQLRFQAENLASTIINNASFNCVATKVIVTHKDWPDRQRFIDMVEEFLAKVPPRKAYYPGAEERFRRFAACEPSGCEPGTLPSKLIRDVDPDRDPLYFEEESFVSVLVETAIDAKDAVDFMDRATKFANERLWGTLGASVMVHPQTRRGDGGAAFDRMLSELNYGTIGVNYWSALSFAMMSPPWGGHPGATLEDPQSGIDWVHNTFMLPRAQKTVVEGPITMFPKPTWFPTHKHAEEAGWKVTDLYHKPSIWKVPGILLAALKG